MQIEYRVDAGLSAAELAALFDRSGIRRPTGDLARIRHMIDNASLTITAWDGEKLVGVARALTDFVYCCYLSDLAVDRDYQRHGIGRELVQQVRSTIGEETTLLLLAAPEAMEYYPKLGFQPIHNGWIIKAKSRLERTVP
jgi:GNAT superfamily N-acetyltransferase